jgi:hypothetical protein
MAVRGTEKSGLSNRRLIPHFQSAMGGDDDNGGTDLAIKVLLLQGNVCWKLVTRGGGGARLGPWTDTDSVSGHD